MTRLYLGLAIRLFASVIPLLEEQAKKTPNPADDIMIEALKQFLEFANSNEFALLLKV